MEATRIQELLEAFKNKRLLVVGDVMLDRFVWGNVSRISPEAPVPVVDVKGESSYPGGAANVARNLLPFCAHVSASGLLGADVYADELKSLLKESGIATASLVRQPDYMTIVKTRIVARNQQVVRIDRETRRNMEGAALEQALSLLQEQIPQVDAVIIEDYGKGFVTQALLDGLMKIAKAEGKIVTVDPNPNNSLEWHGVTAIKPNRSEALHMAGITEDGLQSPTTLDATLEEVAQRLLSRWQAGMLLVTLSEHGMALIERGKPVFHIPTRAREVFDVSGAGDTAIALFTLALAAGATPQEATEISNHASGVVVGKVGTATLTPAELSASLLQT